MNRSKRFGKGGMDAKHQKQPCAGLSPLPESAMQRPWISTNLAISADGKITSTARHPSGWTSHEDHTRLLELRKHADALLVGRATLEADRMTLTVPGKTTQPLRCVASRTGNLPPDHPVFHQPGGPIHILITGNSTGNLSQTATIHRTSLAGFLHNLVSDHHVKHLHCEGGGELIRSLAEIDAIDEFHLTLAGHTLFGGGEAPTPTGVPSGFLPKSLDFSLEHFEPNPVSGECFLSYRRRTQ
jgi:2,5-diamino-6-(ribosylamino)-4(3H)-pyrimidinone 5'-phosphate reductase